MLRAGGPEHVDMRLEFPNLVDRTLDTFLGIQHLVDVFTGNTIGHDRRLECAGYLRPIGAGPREFLDIPEIGPALRTVFAVGLGVPCVHGGKHVASDAMFGLEGRIEGRHVDDRIIERFEQAFRRRAGGRTGAACDDVKSHGSSRDLQPDVGHAAIGDFLDLYAGRLGTRVRRVPCSGQPGMIHPTRQS